MLEISSGVFIDENELRFDFLRASGPGGQNVNKVATGVQLRFDVRSAAGLPQEVRLRLERLAGRRLTDEGVLVIEATRYRSQEANRQDAIERLVELVRHAAKPPKARRATRPTRASKEERLEGKRRRGETKRLRERVEE